MLGEELPAANTHHFHGYLFFDGRGAWEGKKGSEWEVGEGHEGDLKLGVGKAGQRTDWAPARRMKDPAEAGTVCGTDPCGGSIYSPGDTGGGPKDDSQGCQYVRNIVVDVITPGLPTQGK